MDLAIQIIMGFVIALGETVFVMVAIAIAEWIISAARERTERKDK